MVFAFDGGEVVYGFWSEFEGESRSVYHDYNYSPNSDDVNSQVERRIADSTEWRQTLPPADRADATREMKVSSNYTNPVRQKARTVRVLRSCVILFLSENLSQRGGKKNYVQ